MTTTVACPKCSHAAALHDDLHGCLEPVRDCQCEQCRDRYAAGERPIWAELCHCGREGDDE